MEEPPLQKVRHGQPHLVGRGGPRVGFLLPGAIGESDTLTVVGHQARVLEGAAPQIPRQIRDHTSAMAIALHDAHVPPRLPRVPQAVQEVEPLLRAHRLGQGQRPTRHRLPECVHQLPPKDGHHHAGWEEKSMAHRDPLPVRGQPTARHQTVHVEMQTTTVTIP